MNGDKWKKYLGHAKQPDSLTSIDPRRRIEAQMYVTFATYDWDRSKSLLVLGCGDGYEVKLLKDMGWKNIRGITFYNEEYKISQEMGLSDVVQGDIHELPYEDNQFDYVISKETLEHMISPFIALCEINRVLKVDGRFVHYIPTGEIKQSDWYHYMCAPEWLWKDLMAKTGFNVSSIYNQLDQVKYEGYKHQDVSL